MVIPLLFRFLELLVLLVFYTFVLSHGSFTGSETDLLVPYSQTQPVGDAQPPPLHSSGLSLNIFPPVQLPKNYM